MPAKLPQRREQLPCAILAALLGLGVGLFARPLLNDPDTYWHIKTGEWILDHGAMPHADPYSYTAAGAPWLAHEGFSEILMALAYRGAGWNGIVLLFGAASALGSWLLARQIARYLKLPASLLVFALAAACVGPSLLARPHLLALPVLVAWLSGLLAALEQGEAPTLRLLPLMALWANLHGTFAFGLVLILPLALEALAAADTERTRLARGWGLFLAAAVGVSLLTPNGWAGLALPFRYMGMQHLSRIGEWAPLSFDTLQPLELALMALLYFACTRPLRLPLPRVLTLIGLLHMALHHSRHEMLAGVVGAMILAKPLGVALEPRDAEAAVPAANRRAWLLAGAAAAVLLIAVRLAHPLIRVDDPVSPLTALSHVPPQIRQQAVLNSYEFGGYLIFSGVKPFIDGRAEMYGDEFVLNYTAAMAPNHTALLQLIEKYRIRWMILRADSPVVETIDTLQAWRRLYADPIAVVFVRDGD